MSLAPFVRRADPDRYFCALFAPAAHRETLFTLYALNHELARACEIARDPGLALIRLQWWREVVEGEAKPHEVATPLHAALQSGALAADNLLAMIDARERAAEADIETMDEWLFRLHAGPGSLMVAAGRALGAPEAAWPRLRTLGAGEGAAGQLRNLPALTAAGRPAPPGTPTDLAQAALTLLGSPQPCPSTWIAACLPAALARHHLNHSTRPHSLSAKLAILRAGLKRSC